MNIGEIILLISMSILSLISFVISYRQFKEKGYLFNNAYLYASKEERSKMVKGPYYRQSAWVFLFFGVIFLLIVLELLTNWKWFSYVSFAGGVITIVYAIASAAYIEKNKQ